TGLDERLRAGRLRRSGLEPEPGLAVLPEQGVPVPPPAVQLLRRLRPVDSGGPGQPAGAPEGRGRVPGPRRRLVEALAARLGQLRQADRARERAPWLHERAARLEPPRRPPP